MSEPVDTAADARRLDALYRDKARAEIAIAEALVKDKKAVRGQGDVLADVLLVKGDPGPGDLRVGRALAGDDGTAVGKALDALGLPKQRYAFCTRIGPLADASRLARVRLLVEAIDPTTIVLLDAEAAADFTSAFGVAALEFGVVSKVFGRVTVALDGFEASLSDESAKRRVWRQLCSLSPADPA